MNLSPEEREVGRENYYDVVGVSRRDFMRDVLGSTLVGAAGLGAMYFGYEKIGSPLRVGIIGTGDEGNILIGAINPEYIQVVAIADIRPSSIHRAFHGDYATPNTITVRPGLMAKYGWSSEDEARRNVAVYQEDYRELLQNDDVEAVVIALPLHLHARVAIEAMKAGKHVLTEKLMAHNVAQCKVMSRVARETGLHLATGHQRHYSVLYDNAVNLIRWGVLGEIHHIRAQWHRGNLPGGDSWQPPIPGGQMGYRDGELQKIDPIAERLAEWEAALSRQTDPTVYDLLQKRIAQWRAWDSDQTVDAEQHGYRSVVLEPTNYERSALEELVRWRLWKRTGGGLMAELGSHQLDAASIFISALRRDGKKAHPLSVHAVGGRHIFPYNRDAEDHVYCMFEFPGPGYDPSFEPGYHDPVANVPDPETGILPYEEDPNKRIVVSYSSINGNGFGGYGEIVMGTKGTLVLEKEAEVMVYRKSETSTRVTVKDEGDAALIDTTASGDMAAVAKAVESGGPVSRGYAEEMEHLAYCIRNPDPANQPRCRPEIALGDAVIALTANVAIQRGQQGQAGYITFDEAWFDIDDDATPDGSSVEDERRELLA